MFGAVRYVAAGQINTFSLYILSKCNSVLFIEVFLLYLKPQLYSRASQHSFSFQFQFVSGIFPSLIFGYLCRALLFTFFASLFHTIPKSKFFVKNFKFRKKILRILSQKMEVWNSVIIIYFLAFIGQIKLSSFQAFNVSECVQNVLIQNCKEGPDNTESLKSVILHHQHRFSPLTYNAALNNFLTKHFFETHNFIFFQTKCTQSLIRISFRHMDVHLHHFRILCST